MVVMFQSENKHKIQHVFDRAPINKIELSLVTYITNVCKHWKNVGRALGFRTGGFLVMTEIFFISGSLERPLSPPSSNG